MLDKEKAVIFDLDGTPVDSTWMWKNVDMEFLKTYGYECPDDLRKVIEGTNFSEMVAYFKEWFALPLMLDEIKHTWTEMSLDKYRHRVSLKHGAREFLQHVKRLGLSYGIATSNGREMVDAVIEALHIGSYFQVVTTACEVAAGKPEPDVYLKVVDTLQVDLADCLVLEDIPAGILARKRAGMTVCAVEDALSTGMRGEKRELADYFINGYFDTLNGVVE